MHAPLNNAEETLQAIAAEDGEQPPMVEVRSKPRMLIFAPSARVGLILYF